MIKPVLPSERRYCAGTRNTPRHSGQFGLAGSEEPEMRRHPGSPVKPGRNLPLLEKLQKREQKRRIWRQAEDRIVDTFRLFLREDDLSGRHRLKKIHIGVDPQATPKPLQLVPKPICEESNAPGFMSDDEVLWEYLSGICEFDAFWNSVRHLVTEKGDAMPLAEH